LIEMWIPRRGAGYRAHAIRTVLPRLLAPPGKSLLATRLDGAHRRSVNPLRACRIRGRRPFRPWRCGRHQTPSAAKPILSTQLDVDRGSHLNSLQDRPWL